MSAICVNKNCIVMTHALVNFSPSLRICSRLELRGKWMVCYVPQVREEQMVRSCLYVHVCVALPIIVGSPHPLVKRGEGSGLSSINELCRENRILCFPIRFQKS